MIFNHIPYAELLALWINDKTRSYSGQDPGGYAMGCCGTFIQHSGRPQAPGGQAKLEDELPA